MRNFVQHTYRHQQGPVEVKEHRLHRMEVLGLVVEKNHPIDIVLRVFFQIDLNHGAVVLLEELEEALSISAVVDSCEREFVLVKIWLDQVFI